MAVKTANTKILISEERIQFVPSGSDTLFSTPIVDITNAVYEVTCSANTNGDLAPTNQTGSFISFRNGKGRQLIVLYTTGSNPASSASIYVPAEINKKRLTYITASVNHGDTAAQVGLSTFTALSKSLSDSLTTRYAMVPAASHSLVTSDFTVTRDTDKILVNSNRGGEAGIKFNSQLTSSYGFTIKARSTGSGVPNMGAEGLIDRTKSSFALQMGGTKGRDLFISSSKGNVLFLSESGRVGVGTSNPKTQFDIRTSKDEQAGTKFLLRSSRGENIPLQVGDIAGELDFVVESGSFNDIETSGSIGKIKGVITSVSSGGATGKIVVAVAKGTSTDSEDIVEWKYASPELQNYGQIMSASLLIQDYSTTLTSRLEIRKYDRTLYMSAESGSLYVSGNLSINGISNVSQSIADAANSGGGGSADNLGNHTATQDLDLANFDITNVTTGSFDIVQSAGLTANETVIVASDGKSLTSSDLITYDTVNNRVGIGTTSPEVKLHIDGDAAQEAQIRLEQHNNTADAPDIRVRRSRGTHAVPAVLAANDYQFRLNVDIYDGTDYENAGQLRWDNDGTTDNNSTNNVFGLQTRVDGTTADRLTIDANGDAVFSGNVSGSTTSTGSFGLIEGGTF